jgi:hypothetical protein
MKPRDISSTTDTTIRSESNATLLTEKIHDEISTNYDDSPRIDEKQTDTNNDTPQDNP